MPVVLTRLKERRKESVLLAHTPGFEPLHAAEGRHFDRGGVCMRRRAQVRGSGGGASWSVGKSREGGRIGGVDTALYRVAVGVHRVQGIVSTPLQFIVQYPRSPPSS